MRRFIGILIVMLLCFASIKAQNASLMERFRNPGNESKPRAYWNWLNGDVTDMDLNRDLQEAKEKGLGGLLIWDVEALRNPDGFVPEGPPFMGVTSINSIQYAMREAKRLDLDLGLVASSGWNAGGSWVTPEMAGKNLFYASTFISGSDQVRIKLPFPDVPDTCPKEPDGLPSWYLDVSVLAWPRNDDRIIPHYEDVLNLSQNFIDGELIWTPPNGEWQVVRFVCSNNGQQLIAGSPNSKGLFIDFLDPGATRFHFEYIIEKLGLQKGNDPNLPLKTLDVDSMELFEGIQWTTKFREWFMRYHDYDPITWLPVLIGYTIEDEETSKRFIYDYNKTVSDLLIHSHYETGSRVCSEYGLQLAAEAGGPGAPFWDTCPVDALKAIGNVDIPRGEFWMGNPRNLFLIKEIASAAHIYGKPYVDAESWTTWRRWRDGPFKLKLLVDRAFCEGLNRVTYHGFAHSPLEAGYPGRAYHAGVDINPQVVWWAKAKPFMDYLARSSYMLQQGLFVADIAYYYGDQAPNFWPSYHDVPEKPGINGLGAGYDYDVVNTDVILNRMSVKNDRIELPDGMSYRALVLPEQKDIPLEVLLKLEELVSQGATVIGSKPVTVPGMQDYKLRSAQLVKVADQMWGGYNVTSLKYNDYGKGKVVWGYTPQEWLNREGIVSDFSSKSVENKDKLDYIHRKTPNSDIYFVRNKTMTTVRGEFMFRVKNRKPQLWDPVDGSMKEQFTFETDKEAIRLPLVMRPGGSIFIVFEDSPKKPIGSIASFTRTGGSNNEDLPTGQVIEVKDGMINVMCWQNGQYLLTDAKGQEKRFKVDDLPSPIHINDNWRVNFDPKWGAPSEINLANLISWTAHKDDGVKYYSGSGVYNKAIDIPESWLDSSRRVHLDLGDVRELAEIFVNGQSAGVIWKPPFQTDITPFLKSGINVLKIEVMNLWINRLSGDLDLPNQKKYTSTNISSDGSTPKVPAEPWEVQLSGLLGPVQLIPSLEVSVK